MPPDPGNPLIGDAVLTDWATLETAETNNVPHQTTFTNKQPPAAIVEAQGWIIDDRGRVVLTARSHGVTPNSSKLNTSCNGS